MRATTGTIVIALAIVGCAGREDGVKKDAPSTAAQAAAAPAASGFYGEKELDGRVYVFGTKKSFDEATDKAHFPYRLTFIGAGPEGKTVILEADQKDEGLQKRLVEEYGKRHSTALQ